MKAKAVGKELEAKFHEAMLETYRRAAELGYRPTYFLRMVSEKGGYETARSLLHSAKASDGFTRLWEMGRLDLSVEAMIMQPEFEELFSGEERRIGRERLSEYGYSG